MASTILEFTQSIDTGKPVVTNNNVQADLDSDREDDEEDFSLDESSCTEDDELDNEIINTTVLSLIIMQYDSYNVQCISMLLLLLIMNIA